MLESTLTGRNVFLSLSVLVTALCLIRLFGQLLQELEEPLALASEEARRSQGPYSRFRTRQGQGGRAYHGAERQSRAEERTRLGHDLVGNGVGIGAQRREDQAVSAVYSGRNAPSTVKCATFPLLPCLIGHCIVQ